MSPPEPPPPLVQRAVTLAASRGFPHSCSQQVGRLLRVLAGSGDGTAAETGIRSGLGPGSRVVTVEHDADRAAAAASLFAADPRVTVVAGDWRRLADFTVSSTWPPTFAGRRDRVREYWLTNPRLLTTEVLMTATSTAIVGVKRP